MLQNKLTKRQEANLATFAASHPIIYSGCHDNLHGRGATIFATGIGSWWCRVRLAKQSNEIAITKAILCMKKTRVTDWVWPGCLFWPPTYTPTWAGQLISLLAASLHTHTKVLQWCSITNPCSDPAVHHFRGLLTVLDLHVSVRLRARGYSRDQQVTGWGHSSYQLNSNQKINLLKPQTPGKHVLKIPPRL